MSDEINYGSYLALDELLSLQRPRSTPEHPDELLFIIVHQASELWFKAILHDIDGLVASLRNHDAGQSLWLEVCHGRREGPTSHSGERLPRCCCARLLGGPQSPWPRTNARGSGG